MNRCNAQLSSFWLYKVADGVTQKVKGHQKNNTSVDPEDAYTSLDTL